MATRRLLKASLLCDAAYIHKVEYLMTKPRVALEICVETMDDVHAALAGGADRIELCSALALGGLTPSAGLTAQAVAAVREAGASVRAMVRPRDGDFTYDADDLALAKAEGAALIAQGVDGLVFGAVRDDGLDIAALESWVASMRRERADIGLTLHRAIDLVADPVAAVEQAATLGFDLILTSGGAVQAIQAPTVIAAMEQVAAGRITIMPGSGVRSGNVAALLSQTRVRAAHASARVDSQPADPRALAMGFAAGARRQASREEVAALRRAIDAAA